MNTGIMAYFALGVMAQFAFLPVGLANEDANQTLRMLKRVVNDPQLAQHLNGVPSLDGILITEDGFDFIIGDCSVHAHIQDSQSNKKESRVVVTPLTCSNKVFK